MRVQRPKWASKGVPTAPWNRVNGTSRCVEQEYDGSGGLEELTIEIAAAVIFI